MCLKPPQCRRLKGVADAKRRARRRPFVLQVPDNKADAVPCERLRFFHHDRFLAWGSDVDLTTTRDSPVSVHPLFQLLQQNLVLMPGPLLLIGELARLREPSVPGVLVQGDPLVDMSFDVYFGVLPLKQLAVLNTDGQSGLLMNIILAEVILDFIIH